MKIGTKILLGLGIVLATGAIVAIFKWNQPHRDIHDLPADFEVSAATLAAEFQKDATTTQAKYSQKVILFEGVVSDITKGDSLTSISVKGNDFCGLVCELLPGTNDALAKLQVGNTVRIKAFYMGFMEGDPAFGMPGDILFRKGLINN